MEKRRVRYPKMVLSPEQKAAIDWVYGPVFVDATAGAGKSHCLVERIAKLINEKICRPEQLLATTFTKKAAEEMNTRLIAKGIDTQRMSVQTTHAVCSKIIRNDIDYKVWNFDEKERATIILKIILSYKTMNWKGSDQSLVEKFISNCRNTLTPPSECAKYLMGEFADSRYAEAYTRYDAELESAKLYTFDDMLYHGVRILQFKERTLEKYRRQYQFVMVDETQDNNYAQIQLCKLIAAPEDNLYVTADVDQAIYKFRGATPEWLLEFAKEATVLPLGKNYRSCPEIVNAARLCIEYNENRTVKDIVPHRTTTGKIVHYAAETSDDEARFVANEVMALAESGVNYGRMFVLMRTNAQSRPIEERFTESEIPFVVLGASSFYERKEIKRILAYLRVLIDPLNSNAADLVIKSPYRGTSVKLHEYITVNMQRYGGFLPALESAIDNNMASYTAREKLINLASFIAGVDIDKIHPAKLIGDIVTSFDFIKWLQDEDGSDTLETNRTQNIGELISSATRFETSSQFIKYVDKQIRLRKQNQNKKVESRVQVMSIHKSKGLQNLAVFVIGMNDGIFPHSKGEMEEERRLSFVAMTRAMDYLYLTSIGSVLDQGGKQIFISPSQFLYEAGIIKNDLTEDE